MVHAYSSSTQVAETGREEFPGQAGLHTKTLLKKVKVWIMEVVICLMGPNVKLREGRGRWSACPDSILAHWTLCFSCHGIHFSLF
jgi:hypothetical protein